MTIDHISRVLNTETATDLSTGKLVSVNEDGSTQQIKPVVQSRSIQEANENIENGTLTEKSVEQIKDESEVKNNLRELINKSMDLADDMFEVVRASENPKAFEHASAYLKTVAELNEKLLDVHDRNKPKATTGKKNEGATNNTQNNTFVVKSPQDILKLIKGEKE